MKNLPLFLLTLSLFSGAAQAAAPVVTVKNIKKITCAAMAYYEEETPNEKTPAGPGGVKLFTPGSRKDVKPAAGAFILDEVSLSATDARDDGNQQYYFSMEKDGTLSFAFLAEWKASGSLKLGAYDGFTGYAATGILNQKSHITELSCFIELK